mgnify:CR=1 FL=1
MHTLLSLQTNAVPAQFALTHTSLSVQALPSLHAAPLVTVFAHLPLMQASTVHAKLSLHWPAFNADRLRNSDLSSTA